jgi:predicted GNAT family acetyltransferase
MEIKQQDDGKKGLFYIEENGKQLATMTYMHSGDTRIIIDHTEVNPGNEGKGLGKLLVKAGVDFAREKSYKITPLCPYAKSVFDKTPEYKDVLF